MLYYSGLLTCYTENENDDVTHYRYACGNSKYLSCFE